MAEEILTRSSLSSGLTRLDFIRANLLQREGELDATFETHSRLRDHYLARGQEQRYAAVTASQAAIRSLQGRHGEAIVLLEEAIRRFGELEDDHNLVRSLGASGGVFLSLGRLSDARDGFTAAVRIAEENDLRAWEGFARTGLARVAVERLDLDQAEKQLGMAAARFREISLDVTTAGGDIVESEIDLLRGDPQKARNRLAKEPADREGGSDRERGAEVNLTLASVALWSGDSRGALTLATKSAAHYASARNLDGEVDSLTVALTAVSRLADEERRAAIERRLEALLPELESPLRVLRARLALAWSLDAPRARAERLSVERRSAEMGLALVRLEAVHALSQSGEPSERERWRTELAALVRESGARGFLDRPASTR
jgi:tetratricopeptide (TPR) repeat protein